MEQAKWIWYPGDFETYHHMQLSFRRQEYGCDYPCVWHIARPEANVRFRRSFTADTPTEFTVVTRGKGLVRCGGRLWPVNAPVRLPAGAHDVCVELFDLERFPAIYVSSDFLSTDERWQADPYDAKPVDAACEPAFTSPEADPAVFPFAYLPLQPFKQEETDAGVLYDYGLEQFGPVNAAVPEGAGVLLVYGESREEALDPENAILRETLTSSDDPARPARAFRYLHVVGEKAKEVQIEASLEYLPVADQAFFISEEPELERIWALCSRTFHLNTREFFLDGIKRDRWVWSGDAYQSFMIARYLYNDPSVTERTIRALLGKPPYRLHVNTINDYSSFLVISVWEHYRAAGRLGFVKSVWENLKALYAFILSRLDGNGFSVRRPGDWVFIDWGVLDKDGPHCAEQILLWQAHLAMAELSHALGEDPTPCLARAISLRQKTLFAYWDAEKGALIDCASSGKRFVSRQTNILALLYDFLEGEQKNSAVQNALLSPSLPPVTTPYFKLYELMALCKLGRVELAQDYIASYWGGMLKEGATSVWEAYDPNESGSGHYAMYGSPYGKSLCHAWGSGPILLLCRYVAGVTPTSVGAKTYRVAPVPGKYQSFSANIPIGAGKVTLAYRKPGMVVTATAPGGVFFDGKTETPLEPGKTYTFTL